MAGLVAVGPGDPAHAVAGFCADHFRPGSTHAEGVARLGLRPGETGQGGKTEAASSEKAENGAPARAGQKQNVTLNKLLVNVAGTMGSRYLLTSITLLGHGSDFPNRVTQNEPQLRDMASGLLSTKTIADLEKPGARNLIRGELLAGFNSILGTGAVQEIYFTEFAIQ